MEAPLAPLRVTGLLALMGTLLHAVGDVLLLASKASFEQYPGLKPFSKLLSDAEKMVVLPPNRMIWGALIGVFATPLVLAGFWQVYQGLNGANEALMLLTGLLFAVASGETAFPTWVAAVNPVTITLSWMLLKRFLPQFVRDWTEGAGFNITYLIFFALTTLRLWNR